MKMIGSVVFFAVIVSVVGEGTGSPVQKVLDLLSSLQKKVSSEGAAAKDAYSKYSAMCKDRSKDLKFEIKTGESASQELTAVIADESAKLEALGAKGEELAASIATNEAELKKSIDLRATEAADFSAAEKDLTETIDTIERASAIIEREMAKGASMAQLGGAKEVAAALGALVHASSVKSADREKLMSMLQQGAASQDGDDESSLGAPAAAVYESQSGGIAGTLDSLLETAQEQLAEARKSETESLHAFELKKQGLEDQIKFSTKDLETSKKSSAEAAEKKATAEGDLKLTADGLATDKASLEKLEQDCISESEAYEEESASREAELKALAEAKAAIAEATSGAESITYSLSQTNSIAFVQLRSDNEGVLKAVHLVRRLAFKDHSAALSQLASRIESAANRHGEDPFAKVKALISGMIDKLEEEAGAEATQKAYCDEQTAKATSEKEDVTGELEKLSTKLDQTKAASTKTKEEIAMLSKELADLASTQKAMDELRSEESATYVKSKAEMEEGIEGVKLALKILRDYYAAGKGKTGAGEGIIGLLEVCESDFAKLLATMVADEEKAAADYEVETKENAITKAAKEKDVEYKNKEVLSLDAASAALTADSATAQEQLDAVVSYLAELESQCVAKAETYKERSARRAAEIDGLKAALEALSAEAFLQESSTVQRRLRGKFSRGRATMFGASP